MNPYLKTLTQYISKNPPDYVNLDPEVLSELLYNLYRELNPMDATEIRAAYRELDRELDCLPLRQADEIWYQICGICSGHEKYAFLYGLHVGLTLVGVGVLDDPHSTV